MMDCVRFKRNYWVVTLTLIILALAEADWFFIDRTD